MRELTLDFSHIHNKDDLYNELRTKLNLPPWFGNNLDALYDSLTGDIEMPLHLHLANMSREQQKEFSSFLSTFKEAATHTEEFSFSYSLQE